MIARIKDGVSEQEIEVVIRVLARMNDYFEKIYEM